MQTGNKMTKGVSEMLLGICSLGVAVLQLNLVISLLIKPPNLPLATRGCGTDFLPCILPV